MGRRALAALAAAAAALAAPRAAEACTTVAISSGATRDGAAMTMHTTDCVECDFRLALVPGRDHPEGAQHPVYGIAAAFPRFHSDRATIYQNVPDVKPLRHIPEVARTYGVWEASYTLMNEEGLTFGESSCSSKLTAAGIDMADPATGKYGEAYFSVAALMQLGLERCATCRCAVKTIGALAEEYGFYGESFMGGETITMADTTGEAWVFHVQQDFSTNHSAIWVAQRVPDGHIAVIANEFTIQLVPEVETDDFMFSSNLRSEAIAAGFWDGKGDFNFQQVYGTKSVVGDNLYATLREQWIYSQVAPSLDLKLPMSPTSLKFSYPVDDKLSVEAAIELLRGHYDGTEWDLTKGIMAGPFGNPKRIEGGTGLKEVKGALPRPISIPRTSHVHVGVASVDNAVALFGPDEPATTVFAPFFCKTLKEAADMPLNETSKLYAKFYQEGRRDQFGYRESAWWAFDGVANLLNWNYANMTGEFVNPAVEYWQAKMLAVARSGDAAAALDLQNRVSEAWWDLYDKLWTTYNDGYFYFYPGHNPAKPAATFGYPADWLRDIGFDKDFWKVQTVKGQIAKACNAEKHDDHEPIRCAKRELYLVLGGLVVGLALGGSAGVVVGRRQSRRADQSGLGDRLL